ACTRGGVWISATGFGLVSFLHPTDRRATRTVTPANGVKRRESRNMGGPFLMNGQVRRLACTRGVARRTSQRCRIEARRHPRASSYVVVQSQVPFSYGHETIARRLGVGSH